MLQNPNKNSRYLVLRSLIATSFLCGPLLAGCASASESNTDEVADTVEQRLYQVTAWQTWSAKTVPVCFADDLMGVPNFDMYRRKIIEDLERSWASIANVDFAYYTNCPTGKVAKITSFNGTCLDGTPANCASFNKDSTDAVISFKTTSLSDANNHHTVAHEFGHVMGFTHESARSDWSSSVVPGCTGDKLQHGINYGTGATDTLSQMNCVTSELSPWDQVGITLAYGSRVPAFTPLINTYNSVTKDYKLQTPALDLVNQVAKTTEGWAYGVGVSPPLTVPLKLYSKAITGGTMTVANAASRTEATNAGYTFTVDIGKIYSTKIQPTGTVALRLYKNASTGDYLTTISTAPPSGYVQVRVEGFLFQDRPYKVMQQWWTDVSEYELTAADSTDIRNYGVSYYNADSAVMKYQVPGTVPLFNFWSNQWSDTFTSTTHPGWDYYVQRTEGYVFAENIQGTTALYSFWSDIYTDYSTQVDFTEWGDYKRQGDLGWVFPLSRN